jgi:hypothetical protein
MGFPRRPTGSWATERPDRLTQRRKDAKGAERIDLPDPPCRGGIGGILAAPPAHSSPLRLCGFARDHPTDVASSGLEGGSPWAPPKCPPKLVFLRNGETNMDQERSIRIVEQ